MLDELKQTDWYKQRPEIIKQAIDQTPPGLYSLRGKQCRIHSYGEPDSGKLEDVTVTVVLTGRGGPLKDMGLDVIDKGRGVFGVKPDDLTPWEDTDD